LQTVRVVAVGTLKETFWVNALAEYQKRLTKYCNFEIVQIKESEPVRESAEIAAAVRGRTFLLDIQGELVTSADLAARINKAAVGGVSTLSFIIGGSNGVANLAADERISFGRVTLPHQLCRVVLAEQIYRAFTILNNEKYHK
jgi:23S rRNA (pseudouridine1915-N3)-methyltransferase